MVRSISGVCFENDAIKRLIDEAFVDDFTRRMKTRLGRLTFSSFEVISEARAIRCEVLSLMPTESIKATVTKSRFPSDDLVDTLAYLLKLERYRVMGVHDEPFRRPGLIVSEPYSTCRKSRAVLENWIGSAITTILRKRVGDELTRFNVEIQNGRRPLAPEELGRSVARSLNLHRCLNLDRSMFYLFLSCLTISLRETLSGPEFRHTGNGGMLDICATEGAVA